jgi:hypothetical protein
LVFYGTLLRFLPRLFTRYEHSRFAEHSVNKSLPPRYPFNLLVDKFVEFVLARAHRRPSTGYFQRDIGQGTSSGTRTAPSLPIEALAQVVRRSLAFRAYRRDRGNNNRFSAASSEPFRRPARSGDPLMLEVKRFASDESAENVGRSKS